jgi:hypothetical protein
LRDPRRRARTLVPSARIPLALLPAALVLAGCGATTFRLSAGPTIDSGGRAGFTSALSVGVGMPVDFHGRSHHYLQALGSIGGGLDGATRRGMVVAATDLDYIYWAEPRMDVRAGVHYAFQNLPGAAGAPSRFGAGAHAGLLPMVYARDNSWLVTHLGIGPELRAEALSGNPAGGALGLFALPLVIELNMLAAGD